MKSHWIIVLLLVMYHVAVQGTPPISVPENTCTAYIIITGKTNINSFQLAHSPEQITPYLLSSYSEGGSSFQQRHTIHIPVKQFKADNPFIYKDFLELVKASEFPEILVTIPQPGILTKQKYLQDTEISITIAGVTRDFRVSCYTVRCDSEINFLYGTQKLNLTDFNIIPPEKTFGLIKVKNEVIINFGLAFAPN